jgi:hypothetical protein
MGKEFGAAKCGAAQQYTTDIGFVLVTKNLSWVCLKCAGLELFGINICNV